MNTLSYQKPLSDIYNTWQSMQASPSDKATNKLRANRQATG